MQQGSPLRLPPSADALPCPAASPRPVRRCWRLPWLCLLREARGRGLPHLPLQRIRPPPGPWHSQVLFYAVLWGSCKTLSHATAFPFSTSHGFSKCSLTSYTHICLFLYHFSYFIHFIQVIYSRKWLFSLKNPWDFKSVIFLACKWFFIHNRPTHLPTAFFRINLCGIAKETALSKCQKSTFHFQPI